MLRFSFWHFILPFLLTPYYPPPYVNVISWLRPSVRIELPVEIFSPVNIHIHTPLAHGPTINVPIQWIKASRNRAFSALSCNVVRNGPHSRNLIQPSSVLDFFFRVLPRRKSENLEKFSLALYTGWNVNGEQNKKFQWRLREKSMRKTLRSIYFYSWLSLLFFCSTYLLPLPVPFVKFLRESVDKGRKFIGKWECCAEIMKTKWMDLKRRERKNHVSGTNF